MVNRRRIAAYLLTMSVAGFATWQASEGFTDTAVIPTEGDVPTIGHGSTRWEDGTPVKLGDKITRERASTLARVLNSQEEKKFIASINGAPLHPAEFDLYMDFIGQYGIGNWSKSSMRRNILDGNYVAACHSLLKWRRAAGYDCSTMIHGKLNKRCGGVWTRQLDRHAKCMAEQS
jgi:lysozyme